MNSDNTDANFEISALRSQVFNLLIALIVISGTLAYVMYREASMARKQLDALSTQVNQQAQAYNKIQPAITNFVSQLGAYGFSHQDIRPLLNKYAIAAAPTQPAPPGTPQK